MNSFIAGSPGCCGGVGRAGSGIGVAEFIAERLTTILWAALFLPAGIVSIRCVASRFKSRTTRTVFELNWAARTRRTSGCCAGRVVAGPESRASVMSSTRRLGLSNTKEFTFRGALDRRIARVCDAPSGLRSKEEIRAGWFAKAGIGKRSNMNSRAECRKGGKVDPGCRCVHLQGEGDLCCRIFICVGSPRTALQCVRMYICNLYQRSRACCVNMLSDNPVLYWIVVVSSAVL
jgi:hypothetical protein